MLLQCSIPLKRRGEVQGELQSLENPRDPPLFKHTTASCNNNRNMNHHNPPPPHHHRPQSPKAMAKNRIPAMPCACIKILRNTCQTLGLLEKRDPQSIQTHRRFPMRLDFAQFSHLRRAGMGVATAPGARAQGGLSKQM